MGACGQIETYQRAIFSKFDRLEKREPAFHPRRILRLGLLESDEPSGDGLSPVGHRLAQDLSEARQSEARAWMVCQAGGGAQAVEDATPEPKIRVGKTTVIAAGSLFSG